MAADQSEKNIVRVGSAQIGKHSNALLQRAVEDIAHNSSELIPSTDVKQQIDVGKVSVKRLKNEGMILMGGGTFQMGSPTGIMGEQPVHAVTINSFYLDAKQVTVGQYRAFCAATGRSMPEAPKWGWEDDNPIVNVSWDDATAYCAWGGKRLPTEAEWEYAARGGKKGHGYTYSGGNSIDPIAWYWDNSGERTHAVGTKGANELGLFDMSGNVEEWCSDWFDQWYYSVSPSNNPKGPSNGECRVLRGGSWMLLECGCTVVKRGGNGPTTFPQDVTGFRCAMDFK